jgi:hypothetical protein
MITLMLMPNFKGTFQEKLTALFISLALDSVYLIPMANHIF